MERSVYPKFENILPGEAVVRGAFRAVRSFFRPSQGTPYANSDHCPDHLLGQRFGGAAVMLDAALDEAPATVAEAQA